MHNLSENATVAFATFGVILHTGAAARREFCIAFVGECVETGASVDAVSEAGKLAVDYDGMEDAERALYRKQVQYCRAIVEGWSKFGVANQRAFVGGALPASSAAKLIKAKGETPKADDAPKGEGEGEGEGETSDAVKVSQTAASVIGRAEMAVHVAQWLDEAKASEMTAAEIASLMQLLDAVDDFRKREAEAATPVAKAA